MSLFSVFFLLQGRSGLVASTIVIMVFTVLHTPRTHKWKALMLMVISVIFLVSSSSLMLERVIRAYTEITQYQSFGITSLGMRIDMWLLALDNFLEHPLLGTGLGTYHQIAGVHFAHLRDSDLVFTVIHPHNQYLFFAMEYGVLGLICFCWFLWQLAKTAHSSSRSNRSVLFATTVVLAVDSLFNVPLWYRAESYFFYSVLGLLIASNFPSENK